VEMEIKKELIEDIEDVEPQIETDSTPPDGAYRVGDHELFIMPTAYTMEAGQFYFTNYELLFLNYTYAPTNTTHLGAFTLFPIVAEFLETITFGLKQQLFSVDYVKAALSTSYTPKPALFTVGTVFSIGNNPSGLHLGISAANSLSTEDDRSDKWEVIYMAGYRLDVSRKTAIIAEYITSSSAAEDDFTGLLLIGVRFIGETLSWDLAGMRPTKESGDVIFLPYLKATILLD